MHFIVERFFGSSCIIPSPWYQTPVKFYDPKYVISSPTSTMISCCEKTSNIFGMIRPSGPSGPGFPAEKHWMKDWSSMIE
jgi:hypothetical protein